jgi:hypothetical protein
MTIDEWKEDFISYINALTLTKDDYGGIIDYINDGAELMKHHSVEFECNAGDSIGCISKVQDKWKLIESKISRITQSVNGRKIYTKKFYPLEYDEVKENTETMIEADGYINTQEPVLLMPEIRRKCERWIEWANNNPDKAVGLISGT